MARKTFRLPLLFLLGFILCRAAVTMADSEEELANPQVNGDGGGDVSNDDDINDPAEIQEANSYLRKYGYYDDDNEPSGGTQRSAANVEKAIAFLQFKAHIPITGKLNRETIAMMRMPRCGNKDFNGAADRLRRRKRRFSLSGNKWNKKSITYSVLNYTPDLNQRVTRSEIQKAFGIWSNAANINFREVSRGQAADISIRFAYGDHGDGYEFDGQGGVLAHAFFPGRESISGDAHFDEHERFTSNSRDGTNLYMVAAHELGHSLGLGHSDVESSMMAPIYQGYRHGFRLHRDDIMGIQRLYGRRQQGSNPPTNPDPNPGPKPNPPSRPTTPTCNIRVNALMSTSPTDLLAFRNNEYWHLRTVDGQTYSLAGQGFPKPIGSRFRLPRNARLTRIDAAYQRIDGSHRMFNGVEYIDFNSNGQFQHRGQISQLFRRNQRRNMPSRIDAALVVPQANNPVYLFSGRQYWRLNDEENKVDFGYPQPLSRWSRELTPGFDAAFFAAGSVFFVTGNNYRQYVWETNTLVPLTNGQSPRIDRQFFGCGGLHDNTVYGQGNGQAPSRTIQNWALVPAMLVASTSMCQMILL